MAGQGAPHKRGGTHRVKDQDRTNTVYDEWDYKQLKNGCVERSIYVKDMKKAEMARALARYDAEKKQAERNAVVEHEKKQRLLELEKRKEDDRRLKEEAAKHRRRMEKEARRERNESVSDDTPDEDEIQQMHDMMAEGDEGPIGQALSEESWDSTSTDETSYSTHSGILPECKLRLFEWPHPDMPPASSFNAKSFKSTSPSFSPTSPRRRSLPMPRKIPYAPLKVHTTETREKLFFPGQTYPPGVNADFVPLLSRQTRHAARNGILEGILRKATIERAAAWTDRTHVQGSSAHMFFSLAPRNEAKALQDVYKKWYLENRKLSRVEPRGDGLKVTREQRHQQRYKNTAKKLAEVLEASEYRPTALCYLPAYLDYNPDREEVERELQGEPRTLENLFFIQFPGCDVPHYYFWTRKREWADPTIPNPDWTPDMAEQESLDTEDEEEMIGRPHLFQKRVPGSFAPALTVFTRVKNPRHQPPSPSWGMPQSALATTLARIELELHTYGLALTLSKYRGQWLMTGKANAWESFGRALPLLYPSGAFPTAPPVEGKGDISVAMKLASIEGPGNRTMPPPFNGDEPWTTNDDAWWDVVKVDVQANAKAAPEYHDSNEDVEMVDADGLDALFRRGSIPTLSPNRCASWLEQVSPSFEPLTSGSLPASPTPDKFDACVRAEWEKNFLQDSTYGMEVTCPFCLSDLGSMNIEEQARHMFSHDIVGRANHRRSSKITCPPAERSIRINARIYSFDTGAEANDEKSPTKRHCARQKKARRNSADQRYRANLRDDEAENVQERQKRKRIADPTYPNVLADWSEEFDQGMRKRTKRAKIFIPRHATSYAATITPKTVREDAKEEGDGSRYACIVM